MTTITDSDRSRLREIVEKDWVQATLAGDWDASMALCTDDLAYMPQDHPLLNGKEEVKSFFEAFPTIINFTQSMHVATGSTDLAAVRGSFELTLDNEGQEISGQGKFLCIVTKHGSEWLVSAGCFNWDAPPVG